MSDHETVYDDSFGIHTFKRIITNELGDDVWLQLMDGWNAPNVDNKEEFGFSDMYHLMEKLNTIIDQSTANRVLSKVRHGLKVSQSSWARERFLEVGDLDQFIQIQYEKAVENFVILNQEGKDFYGDKITDEVLQFVKDNQAMLSAIRKENKLYVKAFPSNMSMYLSATDTRMKRYYACHCPYAKESILSDMQVSSTLCYCSLGHVMNFWEAVFDQTLHGEVLTSVLAGDISCEYSIDIPDIIMKEYVKSK